MYGYKLKPDGTLFYEIKRDLVTHGYLQGQVCLGRLYHVDPSPGINAPVTFLFDAYRELGMFELLIDVPKIIRCWLERRFDLAWAKLGARVSSYQRNRRF